MYCVVERYYDARMVQTVHVCKVEVVSAPPKKILLNQQSQRRCDHTLIDTVRISIQQWIYKNIVSIGP